MKIIVERSSTKHAPQNRPPHPGAVPVVLKKKHPHFGHIGQTKRGHYLQVGSLKTLLSLAEEFGKIELRVTEGYEGFKYIIELKDGVMGKLPHRR